MEIKKILFCEDFSKNSEAARSWALGYAKASGACIIIIHVIGTWPVHAYRPKMRFHEQQAIEKVKEPVNADLEEIVQEFRKQGIEASYHTRVGSPSDEILNFAKEERADLIIMGTHGWTGFRYQILGSVAEAVLRRATCSVLVVRMSNHDHID
ncbi:MAG: universal stress protein [Deltaproteobacteria bacterium]|nr:universal stress protein [Deltaproteobacteria bacterium]